MFRFEEKYHDKLKYTTNVEIFEDFRPVIDEIGIVKVQMSNTIGYQKTEIDPQPSLKRERKKSFFQKLFGKKGQ